MKTVQYVLASRVTELNDSDDLVSRYHEYDFHAETKGMK